MAATKTPTAKIKARLEYLRGEINAERISYGEIAELQDLAEYIEPGDVLLLQWAGVPEFPDETPTPLFKICEPGGNEPVSGLASIPREHPMLLMIEKASPPLEKLEVSQKASCTFRSSGKTQNYDVVRVQ